MTNTTCIGVFSDIHHADRAIAGLIDAGFEQEEISVVCPEHVHPLASNVKEEGDGPSRSAETAVAGGSIGAVLGALAASVGIAATGGTGLLIAGPLVGATAAGAIGGSFVGAMAARGHEPDVVDYYDQALRKGKILVAIEDDDPQRVSRAHHVFERAGAEPMELARG